MKKIMFDNHYGLEDAVLNGTKTMTRRIIPCKVCQDILPAFRYEGLDVSHDGMAMQHARYKVGEVVAIAQSYHTCLSTQKGIMLCTITSQHHVIMEILLLPFHILSANYQVRTSGMTIPTYSLIHSN